KTSYVVRGRASNYPQWGWGPGVPFANVNDSHLGMCRCTSAISVERISQGLVDVRLEQRVVFCDLSHHLMKVKAGRVVRSADKQQHQLHSLAAALGNPNGTLAFTQHEESAGVSLCH